MRAAVYTSGGEARDVLTLRDIPTPEPSSGEVLVALEYSGINPTDVRTRSAASPVRPGDVRVPHQDGAGHVERVGHGVDSALVGRAVWVFHAAHERLHGTAAEYVCLPRSQIVLLPEGVDTLLGATLGIPCLTAHLCAFDTVRPPGRTDTETVLVTGGAGAVGAATVQLLRRSGARVIATASTEEKASAALLAGAHEVIRYRGGAVAERIRAVAPEGIDRVVDVALAENLPTYVDALAPGAVVVAYAGGATTPEIPMRELMRRNATLRFVHVYGAAPDRLAAAVEDVSAALAEGAIEPVATTVLPLDRIIEAHEAVESGPFGRVLLDVRRSPGLTPPV